MATLKHINSKNADYGAAEQYLLFEHDEFTMKPVLDETGRLIPREDYRLSTLNCDGEDFAVACMRANLRYGKNQQREDVKSHHYIISFDPRDGPDNGLTVDRAQALGEQFCKEHFPGHQALVCTHPDGHNHSGNIHVHIVINSLRIEEVPFLPYMDRPADTKAGCKHRCTDAALRYFKSEVMEMCHREGLYQIDLLNGSKNRITDREYWAQKKGQAALDKQNAPMIADGITPRQTKFETNKEKLRQTIRKALATAASFDEFSSLLLREGVTVKESRGRLSYLTPDRTKPITARKLGDDFDRTAVLAVLEQNAARAIEKAAAIPEYPWQEKRGIQPAKAPQTAPKQDGVQRLVDIEQKMAEGKGRGYERWAKMLVIADTVDDCIRKLNDGRYPTLAGSHFVLTEFDPYETQDNMEYCLERIIAAGYVPVIAHAERYRRITISDIGALKNLGTMIQINAYSIANEKNCQTRQLANDCLAARMVDFIGSDTHRLDHRPPLIEDGVAALVECYSKDYAERVTMLNSQCLFFGES